MDRHGDSRRWTTLARLDDGAAQCSCNPLTLVVGLQVRGPEIDGAPGRSNNSHRKLPVETIRKELRQKSGS
ncbi:MAG: hypothetical protein ABWY93_17635 [Mycobacterium sp.]